MLVQLFTNDLLVGKYTILSDPHAGGIFFSDSIFVRTFALTASQNSGAFQFCFFISEPGTVFSISWLITLDSRLIEDLGDCSSSVVSCG